MQQEIKESCALEEALPKKSLKEILANFLEEDTLNLHDHDVKRAKREMKEACFIFSSTLALQKKLLDIYSKLLKKKSS